MRTPAFEIGDIVQVQLNADTFLVGIITKLPDAKSDAYYLVATENRGSIWCLPDRLINLAR